VPYKPIKRRRKWGRMVAALIIVVIIILVFLYVPQVHDPVFQFLNPGDYREYPDSVEFQLERHIRINNIADHTIDIPVPKDFSSIQEVISLSAYPTYTTQEKYNDNWMIWKDDGNADITITYHMRTKTVVWNFDSSDVMTLGEAQDTDDTFQKLIDNYNGPEWKIDPTESQIVALAEQLQTEGTIYDQLLSIFNYLDENFGYSTARGGEVKSPTETIHDRTGDCDDMSFLYVAISRAMGIPAWVELGALYDEASSQWVGHAWVALYLPLKEGQSGLVNIDVVNREFLVRGANRYTDWTSDGRFTDKNGNYIPDDEEEWHLYDYYYMYYFTPIANPTVSDTSQGLLYEKSGSVSVKLGGQQSIPGFEALLLMPTILLAYIVVLAVRKKNQKR
jgi:hypothetical protein